MSDVDTIAAAIRDCLDKFDHPCDIYVGEEALHRWQVANPGKDVFDAYDEHPPEWWEMESYRIIARAVIAANEVSGAPDNR